MDVMKNGTRVQVTEEQHEQRNLEKFANVGVNNPLTHTRELLRIIPSLDSMRTFVVTQTTKQPLGVTQRTAEVDGSIVQYYLALLNVTIRKTGAPIIGGWREKQNLEKIVSVGVNKPLTHTAELRRIIRTLDSLIITAAIQITKQLLGATQPTVDLGGSIVQ